MPRPTHRSAREWSKTRRNAIWATNSTRRCKRTADGRSHPGFLCNFSDRGREARGRIKRSQTGCFTRTVTTSTSPGEQQTLERKTTDEQLRAATPPSGFSYHPTPGRVDRRGGSGRRYLSPSPFRIQERRD